MNTKVLSITVMLAVLLVAGVGYALSEDKQTQRIADVGDHHDEYMNDYEIYPGDVAEKIQNKEDIVLLDVRTPGEYAEVHLENALLLPVQELSQKTLADAGLGENAKDREIIIYCRSGNRSKQAYDMMQSLGYTNIKSVQGGMIHWEEDEYPYTEMGAYIPKEDTAKTTVTDAPKISLDRSFHDFGVVPQYGGVVETTFVVRNDGTETLSVGTLSTSCACTTAKLSNSEITAGGEATLTVTFDPDLHEEPLDVFKRTVFIPSNDPNTPEAEITIAVDIDEGK